MFFEFCIHANFLETLNEQMFHALVNLALGNHSNFDIVFKTQVIIFVRVFLEGLMIASFLSRDPIVGYSLIRKVVTNFVIYNDLL